MFINFQLFKKKYQNVKFIMIKKSYIDSGFIKFLLKCFDKLSFI